MYKSLKDIMIETDSLPYSFIVGDRRYEVFISQFLGKEGGYSAGVWEMNGDKKEHLYCIQYGKTELEAKANLKKYLLK